MNHLDNFNVILCPTYQIASSQPQPEYSVEAEYGKLYIEGKYETLVHHDDRSDNPAPCNTDVKSYEDVGGTIILSHIDLDSIGGIMAITGDKPNDPEFWRAAEYIDVAGPHHIHELSQDLQDKFNAYNAWTKENSERRERLEDAKDVTQDISKHYDALTVILDKEHPDHDLMIEKGRDFEQNLTRDIEEKCIFENEFQRAFITDKVPCAAGYYSPTQDKLIPSTVTYNETFKSITVAFSDGGIERGGVFSAREIVQELWGPEAGGHDGIAGSPRGREMTLEEFNQAREVVMDKLIEHEQNKDIEKDINRDFEIDR